MPNHNPQKVLILLILLSCAVLLLAPLVGSSQMSLDCLLHPFGDSTAGRIFWQLRLPRVLTAFLIGAALSISGLGFQSLFRNPLATPFTLGVSSGASFGAAIYVWLGLSFSVLVIPGISLFAFVGALLSIILVYVLSRLRAAEGTATMLLAGVAVSFSFSSFILLIQYLSDFAESFHIIRWLMGSVQVVGFRSILGLLPFVGFGILALGSLASELNLLVISEDIATSRGVAVNRIKALIFILVSLMVGGAVAICGPIGFVGMICPHICRRLIGHNHRVLLPATLLFGGTFLVLCDTVARTLIAPAEIPVGVITSLLGGPFFIFLLTRK